MDDFLFKHNEDTIININAVFRRQIRDIYEEKNLITKDSVYTMEHFKNIFLELYNQDKKSYQIYIQIMIADAYKILLYELRQNTIKESRMFSLNGITNFITSADDVLRFIKTKAGIFEDLIECSVAFDRMNLLGKKMVVQSIRDYDEKILKLSPLYAFDILEYGEKTTTDDFLNYYTETQKLSVGKTEVLIDNILFHMRHLYLFDQDNYLENIKEMGRVFYKWEKVSVDNKVIDDNSKVHEYLKIIEENDIKTLGEILLYDYNFLFYIITDFCLFETEHVMKVDEKIYSEDVVDKLINNKYPVSLKQIQKKK